MVYDRKSHGVVELCAFKQHLSIIYYLLSIYDDNEGKLTIWCRLVEMARRPICIDATVAFRTLKLMTETPPPPAEMMEEEEEEQMQSPGGAVPLWQLFAPTPVVTKVNGTWKRVHACKFESAVKSQLASDICDDAKVIIHFSTLDRLNHHHHHYLFAQHTVEKQSMSTN